MNRFLRSHRVLTVERRLVEEGQNSFWKKYGEAFLAATEQKNPVPEWRIASANRLQCGQGSLAITVGPK